jgi:DNA-directed RNA polymerase sigma subunit (sigma70/sigma32)
VPPRTNAPTEREVLRALAPEAFGTLREQERQLVRLYHDLDKDELPSIAEVGQQVGLTEAQVRRRLIHAVRQLLGQRRMDARVLSPRAEPLTIVPAPAHRFVGL